MVIFNSYVKLPEGTLPDSWMFMIVHAFHWKSPQQTLQMLQSQQDPWQGQGSWPFFSQVTSAHLTPPQLEPLAQPQIQLPAEPAELDGFEESPRTSTKLLYLHVSPSYDHIMYYILCTIIYVCVNVWVTGCSLSISERSLLLYSELWSIMIYYDLFIPVNMHNSLQVCLISFKLPWHGRDAMRLGSLRSLRRLRRLLPLLLGHQAGQRLAACGLWRIISAIESLQSFHNVIFINIPYHSNIIEYSIFNGIIWN